MWGLWACASRLVRPQTTPSARPVMWRLPDLPGLGSPPCGVPDLQRGEAREAGLARRPPLLHQALCLLRRTALPSFDDPRCCGGDAPQLEDGQRAREAVHARAAPQARNARPQGGRHRRSVDQKGSHLPHRRQRSGASPTDLVRRQGPLGTEHGRVLQVARAQALQGNPPRRHGHVEAVPHVHPQGGKCSAGIDRL